MIRWALAAVSLIVGFVDLWRGGITIAPLALIAAYCVLVPAALWRSFRPEASSAGGSGHQPSYRWAVLTGSGVFLLYLATLAPTTAMWDTSEYIAAAYTLGFPHPPGNPFFVLLGRVASILPIAPTVAQRINLLAAGTSAAASIFWFLVAERILWRWMPDRWPRRMGAAIASVLGATAFTVWNQSVVNEKVYTIALLFTALVSWLMFRWIDRSEDAGVDRELVVVAYLLGLGYSNHMAGFLPAPAVALVVIACRPATFRKWRLWVAGGAALALGMTPFVAQPIRAAHFPPINEGEVTACTNGPELSCTLSATTWERFSYNFNRKQYGKPPLADRQAPFTAQVGMWWLYFNWQWFRDPSLRYLTLQRILALLFLGLGLLGGYLHWRNDRATFWYFGPLIFSMTLVLIFYMNFRYGFSQSRPPDAAAEVRDRDYFYLWSFSAWGVWAGTGLLWSWSVLRSAVAKVNPKVAPIVAAPVLLLGLVPLVTNHDAASRRHETFTREWAIDLLNSVEPYGILITGGDSDTFPLWYAQEVEGVRRDVTVAVNTLLGLDWYARQLIRREVPEYDSARGPTVYRDRHWERPTEPPVRLSIEESDRLPPYVRLDGSTVFRKDSIVATITAPYLTRDQILLLQMIRDSFPRRGIYISTGAGSYGNDLGLQPYLLTQGFVRKLMPKPIEQSRSVFQFGGSGWFDLDRSVALWEGVYRGRASLIAQRRWIDPSSANTPFAYLLTAAALAEGTRQNGQTAESTRYYRQAQEIAEVAGLERFLTPAGPPPGS